MLDYEAEESEPSNIKFDDLRKGQTWRSKPRILTEAELDLFTLITGDRHPLHTDPNAVGSGDFGGRIFQGTFGIAIAIGIATTMPNLTEPVIAATGVTEWRYLLPLKPGASVYVTAEVVEKAVVSNGRRGFLLRRLKLLTQDGRVAQEGLAGLLIDLELKM